MAQGRKGLGRNLAYQTTRAKSAGPHPDFQKGPRLFESKKPADATRSWWTATEDFYATAKAELGRMSAQNKFGKLNTEIE